MKTIICILSTFCLLISCNVNEKAKLKGTWFNTTIKESKYSKDTVNRFIAYTGTKESFVLTSFYDGWLFEKGQIWFLDSTRLRQIKFLSNNRFEIVFPDSIKTLLDIRINPVYNRVVKNITPNKMIFDLYNNFYTFGTMLNIDTLGDGTIYYDYTLTETNSKSILELEHLVKYYIDKQMKVLPKEEELEKYSQWEKALMNTYTWEDINSKILMECYFELKDTTDKYRLHDNDQLKVKIWQNIK
jgi:hypothetical protein